MHEALACQVGVLAGGLNPLGAPQIGLSGARGEFVLDLQRDVQGERRHQLDQQRADRPVDNAAGYGLAILRAAVSTLS